MTACDAVVVGAGPNGLVAANLLADAGWTVVVLEEQDEPGGGVRTGALTVPGFRHDLCSSFFPLAVAHSPLETLGLDEFGLRWRHAPAVLSHLTPDGRSATLSMDLDATAESVDGWADGDGARWRRAYREWLEVEAGLLTAILTPFPPVRAALRLLRHTGVGGALRLVRRMLMPSRTLGRELFAGEGGQLLLGGLAMHSDVAVNGAASGGYGLLMAMLAQHFGFPVPEGGAGALTDALVARLRQRGGAVVCGVPVTAIDVSHGAARGVHTVDGRRFRARRAVLADVAVTALYQDLLPRRAVPGRLLADLATFEYDPSTVKVDWALTGPVPWRAAGAGGSGTVHLGVDNDGLARYSAQLHEGRIPDKPFLICGQMTTSDPTRSPVGTESFWAYTHLPHRRSWSAQDVAGVVTAMEEALETVAPGFARRVLARHVAGPAQFEEENANLVGGALGGGTSDVYQQLVLRPVPGLGRADTPVDRLFLASASAHPGGGVHGAPGANAARAALARNAKVGGGVYRTVVRGAQRRLYRT